MFRKGLKLGVAALLVVSLALVGCGSEKTGADKPSTTKEGDAKKVLKVGSDIAYAPFEFFDASQKETGFDIELLTAIGEDLGYEVKFETSAFDGLIPALTSGKYDAVISAMTITEKRAQSVLFSDKYFQATQLIAVKEGSEIKSDKDLVGKKVGVQVNTTGQYASEKLGIDPKKFDTTPDAINALINGSVDAVVADSPVVLWFIKQNPNAKVIAVNGDFEKEYYGIAFKKSDTELAGKVNDTLKKFIENGKYDDIYKKWFNTDAPAFN